MRRIKQWWDNIFHKKALKKGYILKHLIHVSSLPKGLSENQVSQQEIVAVIKTLKREIDTIRSWNAQANAIRSIVNAQDKWEKDEELQEALDKNEALLNNLISFNNKINNFKLEEHEA